MVDTRVQRTHLLNKTDLPIAVTGALPSRAVFRVNNVRLQVVVWDTRAKSLPVQRTPLSATGHTYPVYNLHIGGE